MSRNTPRPQLHFGTIALILSMLCAAAVHAEDVYPDYEVELDPTGTNFNFDIDLPFAPEPRQIQVDTELTDVTIMTSFGTFTKDNLIALGMLEASDTVNELRIDSKRQLIASRGNFGTYGGVIPGPLMFMDSSSGFNGSAGQIDVSMVDNDTLNVSVEDFIVDTVSASIDVGSFSASIEANNGEGTLSVTGLPTYQGLMNNPPMNEAFTVMYNGQTMASGNLTLELTDHIAEGDETDANALNSTTVDFNITNLFLSEEFGVSNPVTGLPTSITNGTVTGQSTLLAQGVTAFSDNNDPVSANVLLPAVQSVNDQISGSEALGFDPETFESIVLPGADFVDYFIFTGLTPGATYQVMLEGNMNTADLMLGLFDETGELVEQSGSLFFAIDEESSDERLIEFMAGPEGEVLVGVAPLGLENFDPANAPQFFGPEGQAYTLTITPEPVSALLFGVCMIGLCRRTRWRA